MPSRMCLTTGCPNRPVRKGRCHYHDAAQQRQVTGLGRKVYATKRWKMLRKRVIADQPICAVPDCSSLSAEVDHIVALEDGGAAYRRDNVQALCSQHHGQKTRREQMARVA